MTCQDCPNQTDGKCCHQSIRTQGSKTMNTQDEAAWEREFERVEAKQKQREGWDGKRPPVATNQPKVFRAVFKTQWSTSNEK